MNSGDTLFTTYWVALIASGVVMLAIAGTGFGKMSGGERAVNALFGIAFVGYGVYLGFIFDGGRYFIFFKAFILPALLVVNAIRGAIARGKASNAATGFSAQPYPPQGQPFPQQGQPRQGMPGQPYPQQGMPAQPYPQQGMPGQPYPPQGQPYPPQGMPRQGMPGQPYPPQGQPYPPQGQPYPPQTNLAQPSPMPPAAPYQPPVQRPAGE